MKECGTEGNGAVKTFVNKIFKRGEYSEDMMERTFNTLAREILPDLYKLCQKQGVPQKGKQKIIIPDIGKASNRFIISLVGTLMDKTLFISDYGDDKKISRTLIFHENDLSSAIKTKGKKRSKFTLEEQMNFLMEVKNARLNQALTALKKTPLKTA